MINELVLKNFRCFKDFTLEAFCPVTLIAGANNVGKSSILESIFLFLDRYSSNVFFKLNVIRGLQNVLVSPRMMWESLFYDMCLTEPIIIKVLDIGYQQTLRLEKDETFSLSSVTHIPTLSNFQTLNTDNYALRMKYEQFNSSSTESHFILTGEGINLVHKNTLPLTKSSVRYFASKGHTNPDVISELFGRLVLSGKSQKCIEVLKTLDSRINNISSVQIGGTSGVFADSGLSSLLPVNMLGDGINKLLLIICTMLSEPGCIILIDEIENGFHYSFYPKLWEIIGKLAVETDCQVIATTHSYECISGASVLASDETNLFAFIRLDRIDGIIIPKHFDNDAIKYAVNNNLEVR
jgi:AAA15 family ATPase/GTPase